MRREGVLAIGGYGTDYTKSWIKTPVNTYIVSVGQKFGGSLARWFWLRGLAGGCSQDVCWGYSL